MNDLLQMLAAGGDLALIAVSMLLWKFDRRLYRIEIVTGIKSTH